MSEEYQPKRSASTTFISELYDWVEAGMVAIVCVVLIFTFVARVAAVSGVSMSPTLIDGERVIVTRIGYTPSVGDIVVITAPTELNEPIIKRIIAVGGQSVQIDFWEGQVFVDGVLLVEDYISDPTFLYYDLDFSQPVEVPIGRIFVLGDNRNASWDSRSSQIGMVDERYIMGYVLYRITPFDRIGRPD